MQGTGGARRPGEDPRRKRWVSTVRRSAAFSLFVPMLVSICSTIPSTAECGHESGLRKGIWRMPAWSIPHHKPITSLRHSVHFCSGKPALSLGHRLALRSAASSEDSGTERAHPTPVQSREHAEQSGTILFSSHPVSPLWGEWTEVQVGLNILPRLQITSKSFFIILMHLRRSMVTHAVVKLCMHTMCRTNALSGHPSRKG
jgi:hypothetical protein